jgi:hypothetical protein
MPASSAISVASQRTVPWKENAAKRAAAAAALYLRLLVLLLR